MIDYLLGWGWWADPVLLVVNALAAYRLTRLLLVDALPPLPRVRAALHERALRRWRARHHPYGVDEVRDAYGDEPPLSTLITCPWCLGWWVSAGVALAATAAGPWWHIAAAALALSAAVGALHEQLDREG